MGDFGPHARMLAGSLRSWRGFARECFCFGNEAVDASGEAVRVGLNRTRGFAAREFPRGLNMAAPPPLACSRIPPATQANLQDIITQPLPLRQGWTLN